MKKVVYLLGAGAIKGEMSHQGIESDITMKGIGENVLKLSEEKSGEYWKIHENFSLPEDQDIELMMSLLEGFTEEESYSFKHVCDELRQLFRIYLIKQIIGKGVSPQIHSSLFHLHKNYGSYMGQAGEEVIGVLTINYDSVLDEAFHTVYQGINYGYKFESDTYQSNEDIPPLLKLHGSFNWKVEGEKLIVSRNFENADYEDDYTGWIPPSVYKKPPGTVLPQIWDKAAELLIDCDVCRAVGCSLRNEDFALLSLIFTSQLNSQIKNGKVFPIELIVPDRVALGEEHALQDAEPLVGIMQRLKFLGKVHNFSRLPVFQEESYIAENVFYSWVLMKLREIELSRRGSIDDDFINRKLLKEV